MTLLLNDTPARHGQLPSADTLATLSKNFVWGVATSAYQIEGGASAGGRGPSIWDTFSHTPGKTRNGDHGDIACDHFHRWPQDLELIRSLEVDAYRFSVAWPRVQPTGAGPWNAQGLDFYDRLVDRLLARGMQAHVTLYHWDLPQALQETGGWANRDTAFRFATYAEAVARRLGDRAASIATHNEPWCTAVLGHQTGQFAPGFRDESMAVQVAHHLLLSHGLAMQAMRAAAVMAPLGIVLNHSSATPASKDPADVALANKLYAGFVRWYMDPLFLGHYPQDPGLTVYPDVRTGDMDLIRTPLDFLGVNYYTRFWASASDEPAPMHMGATDMGWEIYPDGLRQLLTDLHRDYRLPPIYITENGMAETDELQEGQVHDPRRIDFVRTHLEAIAQACAAGVDVRGYFYWSLLDNYEWDSGYTKRFGLVHVDYETQRRTPKDSAYWYRDVIRSARAMATKTSEKQAQLWQL
jgi:beta-glucosidase